MKSIYYNLLLSISAAILYLYLIWFNFSYEEGLGFSERSIIGVIFIGVCLFGISLALKPNWLHKYKRGTNTKLERKSDKQASRPSKEPIQINLSGHHPNCNQFIAHIIKVNNKIYCAGCTGLAVGCLISIVLMFFYVFVMNNYQANVFVVFIFLGLLLIFINYLTLIFGLKWPVIKVVVNAALIIGLFLMVISAAQLTGKILIGIVGIILCFLWFETRVQLSNWQHRYLCLGCKDHCDVRY